MFYALSTIVLTLPSKRTFYDIFPVADNAKVSSYAIQFYPSRRRFSPKKLEVVDKKLEFCQIELIPRTAHNSIAELSLGDFL